MKSKPKVGSVGALEFKVERAHVIDFGGEGMPPVLCTPWLIWFLEHAAREALLPFLDTGESTVGVYIELQYLAETPLGRRVVCRASIIITDGPFITFQLEAHDEHERIAQGLHRLRVIRVDRFASRVKDKTQTSTRIWG